VTPRRPHGTGSVYYDAARDRWVGSIETGFTKTGARRRKRVTGKTETIVRRKIVAALKTATDNESPIVGGKPTVRTWAEQWLTNTQTEVRPKTWANNRSQVNRWIIPTIGHKRLDLLAPTDIRATQRAVLAAGLAPATAVRVRAVLNGMLRAGILEGYRIPESVFLVEQPSIGETDRDAIPLIDALAVLDVASRLPDASRWAAALLQGMRPGECLGLTWSNVDLVEHTADVSWQLQALPYKVKRDRTSGFRVPTGYVARQLDGAWHLVRPKTESGRRIIPLVPWMVSALEAWQEIAPASPHGLVWPATDGRWRDPDEDRADWYAITDAAQVARLDDDNQGRRYALYECRHSTATLLKEAGVDDETIVAIMGHASVLSTKAYLHTSSARTRDALSALADRLGLVTPRIEG
jgi:integrase